MAPGERVFRTSARNFSPLMWLPGVLGPPHERQAKPTVINSAAEVAIFFKPGTPESMKDGELDARSWIITKASPRHRPGNANLPTILYSQ